MVGIENNEKTMPDEENMEFMGDSYETTPQSDVSRGSRKPSLKKDLYADLEKIEARGKRKRVFSIFSRVRK
jgi:hypothetical protein